MKIWSDVAILLVIIGAMSVTAGTQSAAQAVDADAYHKDWSVFVDGGDCWIATGPVLSTDSQVEPSTELRRSDARLFVRYLADGRPSEITFKHRYLFEAGQRVFATIETDAYDFAFLYGNEAFGEDMAYLESEAAQFSLLLQMIRGSEMELRVWSPDESVTTDHFSLQGFAAAMLDVESRCKQ
ncbi:hypothetical protein [Hoeflea sp. BAL378]|uniref:hypothetical protein n=1 Tax=Hoeflea sp. BAL378 TaxID=1547437 RepID=UPI001269C583|nr:hypothetical protein [Hoeflea sp. BAL378]